LLLGYGYEVPMQSTMLDQPMLAYLVVSTWSVRGTDHSHVPVIEVAFFYSALEADQLVESTHSCCLVNCFGGLLEAVFL